MCVCVCVCVSGCVIPQIRIEDTLRNHYFNIIHPHDHTLNPHSKICEWGKLIKSDFDTTNAPFKLRHGQPDQTQVAQAFELLHNLTKEALAAQGSMLIQHGQQLMRLEKGIEDLQGTVVEMRTMISELHAERSAMRTMISDLHATLLPTSQGGAPSALLPVAPTVGDGPPPSVPTATHAIARVSAPPPLPSSSKRASTAGKDSTTSLSRSGPQEKVPGFATHDTLIKVYVTFLRNKWTKAEDASTWGQKHHRSTGAKIYNWVHAIATAEENKILLNGSKTDLRGMTCPNVSKVETNLQRLVIGILYQVHKKYLPTAKIPPGINYLKDPLEFWMKKIPMHIHTLNNTLDNIKRDLKSDTKLLDYQKTEFLSPPSQLVTDVRQDFAEKRRLIPYTSSGSEEGGPSKKRSRGDEGSVG